MSPCVHVAVCWQVCVGSQSVMDLEILKREHTKHSRDALKEFDLSPKMGREELSWQSRIKLEREIEDIYNELVRQITERLI